MPKPNLTIDEVNALILELLDNSSVSDERRVLTCGMVRDSGIKFKISRMQVYRYWKCTCDHRDKHGTYLFTTPLKKAKSGRNPLYNADKIDAALAEVPLESRSNLRDVADSLGVPLTTAWRMKQQGKTLISHTNSLKPTLTDQHKLLQVMYAADRVTCKENGKLVYRAAYDEVHVNKCGLRLHLKNRGCICLHLKRL